MEQDRPISPTRPHRATAEEDDRQRMIHSQLALRGIYDQRVLEAMRDVPREEFVLDDCRGAAYADGALPIDCGQTISQPFTVALMCEAARLAPGDTVLEIGTGSGYGAAVLSLLAREVHTVERIPQLAHQAAQRLQRLGYLNVVVHLADGTLGWPPGSPYDAIVVTAAAANLPMPYRDQLREGGRIVIPLGGSMQSQTMHRFTLRAGTLHQEQLGGFAFVPLIGEYGWHE